MRDQTETWTQQTESYKNNQTAEPFLPVLNITRILSPILKEMNTARVCLPSQTGGQVWATVASLVKATILPSLQELMEEGSLVPSPD